MSGGIPIGAAVIRSWAMLREALEAVPTSRGCPSRGRMRIRRPSDGGDAEANREGRRRGKTTNTTMTYCVWWMQAALLEELYESATSEDVTLTALIWDRVDHLPEVADGVRRKDGVSLSEAVAATAEQVRLSDN